MEGFGIVERIDKNRKEVISFFLRDVKKERFVVGQNCVSFEVLSPEGAHV